MNLNIVRIEGRGANNTERVVLKAAADLNLTYYLLVDTTYSTPTSISNLLRHVFWFPTFNVKAGDFVVVYSGVGTQKTMPNTGGVGQTHFFYWNLRETVWNNTGDCAVLMEVANWTTSKYE
jgi:hypothetical protein